MAYNSSYTGPEIDSAIGAVKNKEKTWDSKQNKLNGTEDQLVGFNSAGDAVAVAAPDPLPTGGEEGQVLTKTASGAQWDDVPSDLPAGGTNGQILTKTDDGVAWSDAPDTGVTTFNGRTGAVSPQTGDYTADMVGARPNTWTPSAEDVGAVPTSRTVNGKALSENISLIADDVGARSNTWMPTASDVGAVPTTRTINGKALSSNITLTADDVNAASPPTSTTVTLSASGWASNAQTVTVSGVLADETKQLIQPMPTVASQSAYIEAGIICTAQAADQLTFTCSTVPTADLQVYVVIQEVGA